MAKYDLSVRYYGDALEDNSIPIKELAPSLLSLSEAFQEIQTIVNPNEEQLSLDIKATEKGSFIIDLILVNGKDFLNQAVSFLSGDETKAFTSLVMYVKTFVGSVNFIKKLKNTTVDKSEGSTDGKVKITFKDGTTIEIPKESIEATKSIEFRKSMNQVIKPLQSEGIEGIDFYYEKSETVKIEKIDVSAFEVPEIEDKELETSETEVYLQILNVAFEHGKWRFSNGSNTFYASIEDEAFIDSVKKNQQQFGSTDTLKVKLRTTQTLDKERKLKSEFVVLEVLEHNKGSKQLELNLGLDDSN